MYAGLTSLLSEGRTAVLVEIPHIAMSLEAFRAKTEVGGRFCDAAEPHLGCCTYAYLLSLFPLPVWPMTSRIHTRVPHTHTP